MLAAPFVTTVFLGATACSPASSTSKPAPVKPTPTQSAKQSTKKNSSEPPMLVPPIPTSGTTGSKPGGGAGGVAGGQVGGQGSANSWHNKAGLPKAGGHVTYNRDGTCFGTEKFDCPVPAKGKPKPTCNPPAPRTVQCPPTPSPVEIADARKQSMKVLSDCAKLGTLPKTFSVEISSGGKCDKVYTLGKLDKSVLNCARNKLKKLGWPLHTAGYQIEVK